MRPSIAVLLALVHGAAFADPPQGWFVAGSMPAEYEFAVDREIAVAGSAASAVIEARGRVDGFGTLMQTIAADDYRGARIRLSVYLRTEDAGRAQAWLRVDAHDGRVLAFDNMAARAVTGTSDWRRHTLVLDVPIDAERLAFGFLLSERGKVWADSFVLERVGPDVPVTSASPPLPRVPQNLDFDDSAATSTRESDATTRDVRATTREVRTTTRDVRATTREVHATTK